MISTWEKLKQNVLFYLQLHVMDVIAVMFFLLSPAESCWLMSTTQTLTYLFSCYQHVPVGSASTSHQLMLSFCTILTAIPTTTNRQRTDVTVLARPGYMAFVKYSFTDLGLVVVTSSLCQHLGRKHVSNMHVESDEFRYHYNTITSSRKTPFPNIIFYCVFSDLSYCVFQDCSGD